MADFAFNIAKGRVVEYYNRVKANDPANSALIMVVIDANGDTDAVMKDRDDLSALLGGTANEVTNTNNGTGLFNSITGSPTIQSTTKNTGSYALRCNVSGNAATSVTKNIGANATFVARLYIRFNTLPSATNGYGNLLFVSTGTGETFYLEIHHDRGDKLCFVRSGGPVFLDGPVLSANTWYRVDVKIYVGATTWTLDWTVDGTTQAAGNWTGETTTTFNTGLGIGCTGSDASDAWDGYVDDIVVSQTAGDYPIGPGGTEALIPSSDGTHNAGTNCMEDNAGTDIGATTAYNKINSIPPSNTKRRSKEIRSRAR